MTRTLTVEWHLKTPLVHPRTWHHWHAAGNPPLSPIEPVLGWPHGTIALMTEAFKAGLGRFDGWDVAAVGASLAPYRQAAKVYKRGVSWRAQDEQAPQETLTGRYDISVPPTAAKDLTAIIPDQPEAFLVIDQNVAKAWSLEANRYRHALITTVTEHTKTLETVAQIITTWRAAGSPSHWVVVGGGILADLAAFAAALSGATFSLVPTTLLAMADACVGGKTGVNFPPYGKNQIGLFAFPTQVVAWAGWLKTLDQRNLRSGMAECFKHAFLTGDRQLAEQLESAATSGRLDDLAALLPKIIQVKADVVAQDPGEAGLRATLNLGHTLAHALEAISQGKTSGERTILHGEAVGVGLAFAAILSSRVAGLPASDRDFMLACLKTSGCVLGKGGLETCLDARLDSAELWQQLMRHVHHDKKATSSRTATTRWVLLEALGQAVANGGDYTVPVAEDEVKAAWAALVAILD